MYTFNEAYLNSLNIIDLLILIYSSTNDFVYIVLIIYFYFKQTISMNNKFWNAPAWSMGNKQGSTIFSK